MAVKISNTKTSRALIALSIVAGLVASSTPANALGTAKVQASVSWTWQDSADRAHRDFAEEIERLKVLRGKGKRVRKARGEPETK
jgi:hypothetical protein